MSSESSFSQSRVYPALFDGWGKQTGLPPRERGGLKDVSFVTRCPPDLSPSARILAVCGITDFVDTASPMKDGWFFSDFYLFHHILKGVGANQIWLTSEDPRKLVEKYECYAHGNPFEERRVVLDEERLPDVLAPGNLRIVPRKDLCERFASTIRSETTLAAQKQQPLLLLIFGHGDPDTHGVSIGLRGGKPERFNMQDMRKLTETKQNALAPKIGLMMTSCYSGGWVMSPNLNLSAMSASSPDNEILSWSLSRFIGRACGSIYVAAVVQALIKMEGASPNEFDPNSSTYAQLGQVVYDTLCIDVDRQGESHKIMFSAQNDEWESEWQKRSGIPLNKFRERWEMLRTCPPNPNELTNRDPAGFAKLNTPQLSLRGGGPCKTVCGLEALVRAQARQYMTSKPGPDNMSGNHAIHSSATRLLKHESFDFDDLVRLHSKLDYRLSLINLATQCKQILGLPFVDCAAFDLDEWHNEVTKNMLDSVSEEVCAAGNQRYERWKEVYHLLMAAHIFPKPDFMTQGLNYMKPLKYLAVAISACPSPKGSEYQVQLLEEGMLHRVKYNATILTLHSQE